MNCAFLNILTTMNDLYGSHNCPFSFGIDLISWDELGNENIHRFKKINMIPDEEILGNGMSVHEIINADFKIDEFNGISLKDGLTEIYNILKNIICILNKCMIKAVLHSCNRANLYNLEAAICCNSIYIGIIDHSYALI